MKYFRKTETEKSPEELTREQFIRGVQGEFMFGPGYYEHIMMLFGKGEKLIGSRYMYWMTWED